MRSFLYRDENYAYGQLQQVRRLAKDFLADDYIRVAIGRVGSVNPYIVQRVSRDLTACYEWELILYEIRSFMPPLTRNAKHCMIFSLLLQPLVHLSLSIQNVKQIVWMTFCTIVSPLQDSVKTFH